MNNQTKLIAIAQLKSMQDRIKKISLELSRDEHKIDDDVFFDLRKRLEHVEQLLKPHYKDRLHAIPVDEAHMVNMLSNGQGC